MLLKFFQTTKGETAAAVSPFFLSPRGFKAFPLSVEANQQRLMTNAYYPFDLESEEAIYRKCY